MWQYELYFTYQNENKQTFHYTKELQIFLSHPQKQRLKISKEKKNIQPFFLPAQ